MKYVKIIVTILILIQLSCSKDKIVGVYTFTDEELGYIQYNDGQVISYLDGKDSNQNFIVSGPVDENHVYPVGGQSNRAYIECTSRRYYLLSENFEVMYYFANWSKYSGSKKAYLVVNWDNMDELAQDMGASFKIPIDSTDIGNNELIESIVIQGNSYSNVLVVDMEISNNLVNDSLLYPTKYYFKEGLGVIRFEMSDSTNWDYLEMK